MTSKLTCSCLPINEMLKLKTSDQKIKIHNISGAFLGVFFEGNENGIFPKENIPFSQANNFFQTL